MKLKLEYFNGSYNTVEGINAYSTLCEFDLADGDGLVGQTPTLLASGADGQDLRPVTVRLSSDRETKSNGSVRMVIRIAGQTNLANVGSDSSVLDTSLNVSPELHTVVNIPAKMAQAIINHTDEERNARLILARMLAMMASCLLYRQAPITSDSPNKGWDGGSATLTLRNDFLERALFGMDPISQDTINLMVPGDLS